VAPSIGILYSRHSNMSPDKLSSKRWWYDHILRVFHQSS